MPGKTALVLSGGGAYAAYEIGVLRALFAESSDAVEPQIYTGTSAGALNAAIMTAFASRGAAHAVAELARIWLDELSGESTTTRNGVLHLRMNPFTWAGLDDVRESPLRPFRQMAEDALSVSESLVRRSAEFFFSGAPVAARAADFVDVSSFVSTEPLRQTLRRVLSLEAIRQSPVQLMVPATDWTTGELRVFGNDAFQDDIGYAVIEGSTAIPGLFLPVSIGSSACVDGGLIMNTPLKPAIDGGASVIHIVYLDPDICCIPIEALGSTVGTLERALSIAFAARANSDIENARDINEGLAILNASPSVVDAAPASSRKALVRTAARLMRDTGASYHPLTIHRYHPREDLGTGIGVLDFSRCAIQRLIDRGYRDALRHNCEQSGCVLPK